ncbi:MAG: response regulator [Gemmatimonadota bacterium]|nr:response regulator [Gemmatimonadota bacterium]
MKVLIVDDNIKIRQLLRNFLTESGWSVQEAASAEQALEMLDESVDVVLTDVKMGRTSGLDLLRMIREKLPHLEVILMTGHADIQDSIDALSLRAFAYIKKPFEMGEVNQKLLEAARARNANQCEEYYKKDLEQQVERQTAQLRIEKERFQSFFSTVPSILLVIDKELGLVDGNQFLEHYAGRPAGDLIGQNVCRVLSCSQDCQCRNLDDLPGQCPFFELIKPTLAGPDTITRRQVELETQGAGGVGRRTFRGCCCQLPSKTGETPLLLLMLEDITREKELEYQLIHTGRMTALGEMATGVAHELNQPLNGIAGYIQLMESRIAAGRNTPVDKQLGMFRDMMHEINRMSEIINHLRMFSRSGKTARADNPVDIKSAYVNSMKLLRTQMENHGIEVVESLPPGLPYIAGDQDRLQQVIMNLLVNARDALLDTGEKGCDTGCTASRGRTVQVSAREKVTGNAPGVEFVVADNGPGIPPERIKSIFDPFFTTKESGKGTGLGLSISYGIISEFGGTIEVKSTRGAGTSFYLWLKCYLKPAREAKAES